MERENGAEYRKTQEGGTAVAVCPMTGRQVLPKKTGLLIYKESAVLCS